jgi:hypothetical protein
MINVIGSIFVIKHRCDEHSKAGGLGALLVTTHYHHDERLKMKTILAVPDTRYVEYIDIRGMSIQVMIDLSESYSICFGCQRRGV